MSYMSNGPCDRPLDHNLLAYRVFIGLEAVINGILACETGPLTRGPSSDTESATSHHVRAGTHLQRLGRLGLLELFRCLSVFHLVLLG